MSEVSFIKSFHAALPGRLARLRRRLRRPLTLTEKILGSHLDDLGGQEWERGGSLLRLRPDRLALQDATAQMVLLQFISSGRPRAAVPTTVHCDHLIVAQAGAEADLAAALKENAEVYAFLSSAARKYGLGFWKPGAGIIHQVLLENHAFPGGLLIGADSHTPNAGGMGMAGVGVGGAEAVDAMVGLPWELLCPRLLGIRLVGNLSAWAGGKDVILRLLQRLGCEGGTNKVLEYFGPGVANLSLTARATIANLGAELGATTSLFPCDSRTLAYLRATGRAQTAAAAGRNLKHLEADPEVLAAPEKHYDEILEIRLDEIEPLLAGPDRPDSALDAAELKRRAARGEYPDEVRAALIGSCANASYEDLGRAARVARQAAAKGLVCRAPLLVTPGSERVRATLERDGLLTDLKKIGAAVLANACGPCIGQWRRADLRPEDGEPDRRNVILTSFNRNFRGRNDGCPNTLAFVGSPELVVAKALAGRLSFDPRTDTLNDSRGQAVKLEAPVAAELPPRGFLPESEGFQPPARDGSRLRCEVAPGSERLQLLAPFPPWDGKDLASARILAKVKGQCTTDHISPAGKWLRYRGHLDRISDNLLLGAVNAFTGGVGCGRNLRTGVSGQTFAAIARDYQSHGVPWIIVGDANYGEGSSREHAALEPRHLGGRAVVARSFARIHETNLKKQGLLAMTFANPKDYDRLQEQDLVGIEGLSEFAPGRPLALLVRHADGAAERLPVLHGYSREQVEWFKAGSALNLIRRGLTRGPRRAKPRSASVRGKKIRSAKARRKTRRK